MIGTHPKSIEAFRAVTAARAPLDLRAKKCACGRRVFAKQLVQYGMCDKCRERK